MPVSIHGSSHGIFKHFIKALIVADTAFSIALSIYFLRLGKTFFICNRAAPVPFHEPFYYVRVITEICPCAHEYDWCVWAILSHFWIPFCARIFKGKEVCNTETYQKDVGLDIV